MNRHSYVRKIIKYCTYISFSLVMSVLLFITTFFLCMRFDFVENMVRDRMETYFNAQLDPYAIHVAIEDIRIDLPFSIAMHNIKLSDKKGEFASLRKSIVEYDFFALFSYAIVIQDVSLENMRFIRMPRLIFPKEEPIIVQEEPFLSQMEMILDTIAPRLFHKYMPTFRIEKINIQAFVGARLIQELSEQAQSTTNDLPNTGQGTTHTAFQEKVLELDQEKITTKQTKNIISVQEFQDIMFTTTLYADLNTERFHVKSNITTAMLSDMDSNTDTGASRGQGLAKNTETSLPKEMHLTASLDLFKNKKIETRIRLQDENAMSMRIFKEIFDLPPSKKAHASFSLEGEGFVKTFLAEYEANIFDDAFMNAPTFAQGKVQLFPFFADIDLIIHPAISGIIDAGAFSLKAKIKEKIANIEDIYTIEDGYNADISKIDTSSSIQDTKRIGHKINISYTLSSSDVRFAQSNLQEILGNEQNSQGQVDITLSPHALPRIEMDTLLFKAKGFNASVKAHIAQDVNMQIQASLPDLSVISAKEQRLQGSAQADIKLQGRLNNLSLHASLSVPTLDVRLLEFALSNKNIQNGDGSSLAETTRIKDTQDVSTHAQNRKNVHLNALLLTVKSKKNKSSSEYGASFSKNLMNKQGSKENLPREDAFTIESSSYIDTMEHFFDLLAENTRQMYSLFVDFSTQYNDETLQLSSELVFSESILDEQTTNPRRIYAKNMFFQGLGGELDGNIDLTWDALGTVASDFAKIPLIRGTVKGRLDNTQRLTQIIDLPVDVENMQIIGSFSANQILTNRPLNVKNEGYRNFISYLTHSSEQKISVHFSSAKLRYEDIALEQVAADIAVENIWFFPTITAKADVKKLHFGSFVGKDYALQLDGSLNNLQIQTSLKGDVFFDFVGNMGWSRKEQDFALEMTRLSLQYPTINMDIHLKQKAQIRLSSREFSAKTVELFVAPRGKITLDGVLRSELLSLNALWKDIDLATFPINHKGIAEGSFSLEGSSKNPIGTFEARLHDLQTQRMPPISLEMKGSVVAGHPIHRLALELSIIDKEKFGARDASLQVGIPLESTPFLHIAQDVPLQGSLMYDGNIASLWQYVPLEGRRLTGTLQIDGKVSGDITQPQIELRAEVKKARYEDIISGILIQDIYTQLFLEKNGKGSIDFSCVDGKTGTISLKGSVEMPALMSGEYKAPVATVGEKPNKKDSTTMNKWIQSAAILDLTGEIKNFQPLQRNDIQMDLSGDFYVQGMIEDPSITGSIAIENGDVNLLNITSSSIPTLNIVEDSSKKQKKQAKNIGNLNVQIHIPNNFFVHTSALSTEWQGDLNIKGKLSRPTLAGTLSAVRGSIIMFGKEFKLSKGTVYFDGSSPIAPTADMQLSYTSKGLDALVSLSGTASNPHLELSSVPYLPQDEVLAHVLFGASMDELSAFEQIQLATALTRLAGFSVGEILTNVGRTFIGLDVLRVGKNNDSTKDDEEYTVELGKYVNDDLYIGVEQGINSQNTEGIADWRLNNHWSTGTRLGTEDARINLEWKYEY